MRVGETKEGPSLLLVYANVLCNLNLSMKPPLQGARYYRRGAAQSLRDATNTTGRFRILSPKTLPPKETTLREGERDRRQSAAPGTAKKSFAGLGWMHENYSIFFFFWDAILYFVYQNVFFVLDAFC